MKKVLAIFLVLVLAFSTLTAMAAATPLYPELPDNASVVLDRNGKSFSVGTNYGDFWGRSYNKLDNAVDFSNADYIEFDIHYSSETLKNALKQALINSPNSRIEFTLISSDDVWTNRARTVDDFFGFEVSSKNGWAHYRVPRTSMGYGELDWTAVNSWWFLFEGISGDPGEIANLTFDVKNICATNYEPTIPANANAVLDKPGKTFSIGNSYSELWNKAYSQFINPADFSGSDYIEFDIKYSSEELKAALQAALASAEGSRISFDLMSSTNVDVDRNITTDDFFGFEVSSYGGWYHYRIPRSAFGYGNLDWTNVISWTMYFEGIYGETGALADLELTVKNVCGTANKPEMPLNAVVTLDERGKAFNMGANYGDLWGISYNKLSTAVDFTSAEYVEFDIYYSNDDLRNALIAALNNAPGSRIEFTLLSSDNVWTDRARTVDNFFGFETSYKDGWAHYKVPRTSMGYGELDWSAVNSWWFLIEGLSGSTGDIANLSLDVRNICGTVGNAVPATPANSVGMLDKNGKAFTIGASYGDLWALSYNKPGTVADLSGAEYIEFDIRYSSEELKAGLIKAIADCPGSRLEFNIVSSEDMWSNRIRVVETYFFDYEVSSNNGWYHYRIPVTAFGYGEIDWTAVNSWFFVAEGVSVATGDVANLTMELANLCGTVYDFVSDVYTVADGYITVPAATHVQTFDNNFLGTVKPYDEMGLAIEKGYVKNGMKAGFSIDGIIYKEATVIVTNDIAANGFVDTNDLVLMRKILLGISEADSLQKLAVAGNADEALSIIDLIRIKKAIAQ